MKVRNFSVAQMLSNFFHWLRQRRLSALFDADYYWRAYPDVAHSGASPLNHYLTHGWLEGRRPAPNFDGSWYLQEYPDAAASGLNPLLHHVGLGRRKARATAPPPNADHGWMRRAADNIRLPNSLRMYLQDRLEVLASSEFNPDYYAETYGVGNPDLVEDFLRQAPPFQKRPNATFDCEAYYTFHGDVRLSGQHPFIHYLRYGKHEGRISSALGLTSKLAGYFQQSLDEVASQNHRLERFLRRVDEPPLVSVVVPAYKSDLSLLSACIRSVVDGVYPNWELIVVDDGSRDRMLTEYLVSVAKLDPRIQHVQRELNGNISCATNTGLERARGRLIGFLDHDDEFYPDALLSVAEAFIENPGSDIFYTDQVKCNEAGEIIDHFFKPDWSPVYLLGVMYVGHLVTVDADLLRRTGWCDGAFDGVQDYELMLRLSERSRGVVHISRPIYKWRAISGSLAAGVHEKTGIDELQKKAAQSALKRRGLSWVAENHKKLPHRIVMRAGEFTPMPSVDIVIPTKDQGELIENCLKSIFEMTRYPSFRITVVDNGTTDTKALAAFDRYPLKCIDYDSQFNFSEACNIGAARGSGELVLFLNNDTEIVHEDWLRDMTLFFEDPSVGAVGPVLLYPDGKVQHAGIVLGSRGTADHVMRFFPEDVDGYGGSLACAREVSAVTGACLLIRRELFEKIGQFSTDYAKHYQDVDLCLKLREIGKSIVCVGNVRLMHHESVTRKSEGYDFGDRAIFIDRWFETIQSGDPFYNKSLSIQKLDYSREHLQA